ncbi:roundabout homolog 1-like isoform X5 [Lates japonicus]|uniref:Roundabout homolog 1-like isoform X5 n=1 Tax=Lates japonicus TaxID=270547 RepID=A0AAD3MGN9_LATJO|nr:roundabout homolog 1-like isoform X5 [Lates japonicus]
MQIVSLLVVLFAMLVMLGVPKDHKGPHGAHRNTGLQKSHWCKRPPNNFGPRQNHQTVRHSHSKPHKCNQALHSSGSATRTKIDRSSEAAVEKPEGGGK